MISIDDLAISLSSKDASSIIKCIPLSDKATILDVYLIDNGIETIVRTSAFLGMPLRLRFQLVGFQGSKITLRTSPPLKYGLESDLKPLTEYAETTTEDSQSVLVLDLLTLGKGSLKSIEIVGITIRKEGLSLRVRNVQLEGKWQDLLTSVGG